jgi:hypothetical protein
MMQQITSSIFNPTVPFCQVVKRRKSQKGPLSKYSTTYKDLSLLSNEKAKVAGGVNPVKREREK